MNHLIILLSFAHCLLTFCGFNQTEILKAESSTSDRLINNQDSLFILEMIISDNFVRITPPNQSDFELPDKLAKTEPYGNEDFNADGKEDVLVYLGACGTGGCMYGLFLKQIDNYYKLAFMDYLKNPEFKVEKNGFWTILSYEEIEPYNPTKLRVTKFKFNKNKYQYEMDTSYVYIEE